MSEISQPGLPRLQRGWLIVHWWALLPCLYLLLFAVLGTVAGTAKLFNVVTLFISVFSTTVGAVFATRIARAGVLNATFVKGSTTARVIAVAWLLLGVVLIWVPVIETIAVVEIGGASLADGLLGTLGSLSILAIVGPGYSEYRDAMASAARPLS